MTKRKERYDDDEYAYLSALDYKTPKALRAIRVGLRSVIVGAVAILLWTGFWFVTAFQLRANFEAWVAHQRANAVSVDFRRFQLGGYPFNIRLSIENPTLTDAKATVPWIWSGEGIVVQTRPWHTGRLSISVPGKQQITLGAGPHRVVYSGGARVAEIELTLGSNAPARRWPAQVRVSLSELRLLSAVPGRGLTIGDAFFNYDTFDVPKDKPKAISAMAEISIRNMHVPSFSNLPLGNAFQRLNARAIVNGRVWGKGAIAPNLARWRDLGGTIDLRSIHIENGPLKVQAGGTLALDGALQPVGVFTAKVEGLFALLDRLRAQGVLRDRDVVTAKLVLGALFKRSANGGPPTISMAITLQNRKLFIGPVQIAQFPPVNWSGAQKTHDGPPSGKPPSGKPLSGKDSG